MSRFRTGLVVGKFAPLHLGHELVIRTALARCEQVVLLSYTNPEFTGCEPAQRTAWLGTHFPEALRLVLSAADERIPVNSAPDETHRAFCADVIRRRTGLRIDAIFSSESYGPGFAADFARRQGAPVVHVSVDAARQAVPISGTALRADIHRQRRFLAPEVYASFVERVALLGGESTGKSVLAAALARELSSTHVAEYGRELWDLRNGQLTFPDLLAIAREQIRREDAMAADARTHRFVICDTTPLTTLFYSLDLFGHADPELLALARRTYHHTILCGDDFPFVQDGTRRESDFRSRQQAWYRQRLAGLPHLVATGPLNDRLCTIRETLNAQQTFSGGGLRTGTT